MKRKVLIITGCYLPGVKGGGPIRSITNLVDNLSEKFDFYIITSDRDWGDSRPFENIITDEWVQVGHAKVFYTAAPKLGWGKLVSTINSIDCETVYLVSFFAYKFSIVPVILWNLKKLRCKKIVLSPSGEFSPGALSLKKAKKGLYVAVVKMLGLYRSVGWHATTKTEQLYIERVFGNTARASVARQLTANYKDKHYDKNVIKNAGELKLVYIARIHPMKNLLQTLEILKQFDSKIEFNIYGPIEDSAYWAKCQSHIAQMRHAVRVTYGGWVQYDEVDAIYKKNHVAILLTHGENFGHSISEALIGGCPVIISNRTPWQDLENHNAGWALPLENVELIAETLRYFVDLDHEGYQAMSRSAFEYGKNNSNRKEDIESYYELLSR